MLLIVLGSMALQFRPLEMKHTCLGRHGVRAWLIWFPSYPLPYTCYGTSRRQGPHTLEAKAAIRLQNGQMTMLLRRGEELCRRLGSHESGYPHTHSPHLLLFLKPKERVSSSPGPSPPYGSFPGSRTSTKPSYSRPYTRVSAEHQSAPNLVFLLLSC